MEWTTNLKLYEPYLHRALKKGRGVGSFDSYRPWVQKSDFGSKGSATTVQGIVVPRLHHVLSDLEHIYLMLLERQPTVVDIREQWPILHINQTLALCEELGVPHRYENEAPVPFTIDFLVTTEVDGKRTYSAKSIKTPMDANKPAIRRRLAVEHKWCESKGVSWVLVKTDGFHGRSKKVIFENLSFMRDWYLNRYQPDEKELTAFVQCFRKAYDPDLRLDEILDRTSKVLRISEPLCDNIFRFSLWRNLIPASLREKIALTRPLILNS